MADSLFSASAPGYRPRKLIPLPRAPRTTSPVPWLTSIHSSWRRGPYGDSRYRGNCGGYLIKDLLRYFQPENVLDPMTGSGTCRDVCDELGIPCTSFDLRSGRDALDSLSYQGIGTFDFAWMHPPYWRQIKYSDDPRCLSNAPTLDAFIQSLRLVIANCCDVLRPEGRLAILIGNYEDRGRFIPLTYLTMCAALAEHMWPACTDIVRLQHANSSSLKSYSRSFVPGLHDVCMVFEKADDVPVRFGNMEIDW